MKFRDYFFRDLLPWSTTKLIFAQFLPPSCSSENCRLLTPGAALGVHTTPSCFCFHLNACCCDAKENYILTAGEHLCGASFPCPLLLTTVTSALTEIKTYPRAFHHNQQVSWRRWRRQGGSSHCFRSVSLQMSPATSAYAAGKSPRKWSIFADMPPPPDVRLG